MVGTPVTHDGSTSPDRNSSHMRAFDVDLPPAPPSARYQGGLSELDELVKWLFVAWVLFVLFIGAMLVWA